MIGRMMRSLWLAAAVFGLVIALSFQFHLQAAEKPSFDDVRKMAFAHVLESPQTKNWKLTGECHFSEGDVTIFGFRLSGNRGKHGQLGALVVAKGGKITDSRLASNVYPIATEGPSGCVEKWMSDGRTQFLYRAFDPPFTHLITAITGEGRIGETLFVEMPDRQFLIVADLEGNGSPEALAYGLCRFPDGCRQDDANDTMIRSSDAAKQLRKQLGVLHITAVISRGTAGYMRAFTLRPNGSFRSVNGRVMRQFLVGDAEEFLELFRHYFSHPNRDHPISSGFHNFVLAYFGILEAIDDPETALNFYNRIPPDIRGTLKPELYVRYLTLFGRDNLIGQFSNKRGDR